nr:alpha/beta hydrolase [Staphylococcus epidermidis]
HLDKPDSKENIKKVLLFLSRNTSSSGVESNESSQNQPTQNTNEVSLYPFDS